MRSTSARAIHVEAPNLTPGASPHDLRARPSMPFTPFSEKYLVGSRVRVAGRARLEHFRRDWQSHHPLEADQLAFAGKVAIVRAVDFFHSGDVVYVLDG